MLKSFIVGDNFYERVFKAETAREALEKALEGSFPCCPTWDQIYDRTICTIPVFDTEAGQAYLFEVRAKKKFSLVEVETRDALLKKIKELEKKLEEANSAS